MVRPTSPVTFKESYLATVNKIFPKLGKAHEYSGIKFTYYVNVLRVGEGNYACAIQIWDVEKKYEPITHTAACHTKQEALDYLRNPNSMFNIAERDVFIFEGETTVEELQETATTWILERTMNL